MAPDREAVDPHGAAPLQRAPDGKGIRPRYVCAGHARSCDEIAGPAGPPSPVCAVLGGTAPRTTTCWANSPSNPVAMKSRVFTGFLVALVVALAPAAELN